MSKVLQGLLRDNIKVTNSSVGAIGGLSTSDSKRLSKSYPDSPSNGGKFTDPDSGAEVNLTREDYRQWFQDNVLSFEGHSSEFGETVSLNYTDSPNLKRLNPPEDEKPPGNNGATIVSAGIGPNVNVRTLDEKKNVIMVDPTFIDNLGARMSLPPFVGNGSASPSQTSSKVSKTTLGDLIIGKSQSTRGGN